MDFSELQAYFSPYALRRVYGVFLTEGCVYYDLKNQSIK